MTTLADLPPDLVLSEKPRKRAQPELRMQIAIMDRIHKTAMPGVYVTAIPNGEDRPKTWDHKRRVWRSPTGERLKRSGLRPGNPDLLLIVRGRAIGIELKAGKNAQSKHQIAAESDWTLAGGLYRVCRSYDEAIDFLEVVGAIRVDRSITRPQQEARA